ncbi:hypothetical protein CRG98_034896 [Punica granatum]|uniref:CCHC-type domain-containing protein n=1 Tax=Punica granatum TaxID=22663 RepID=A0A2I0IL43_PUNGR|nr:hypothetical protein CRG98_034896 [Punica granatum]
MVANEERQRVIARSRESAPESVVFLAREEELERTGTNKFNGFAKGKGTCSNCGKVGHSKNSCWALIGYPSWHSKSRQNAGKGPEQGQSKQSTGPRGRAQIQRGPDRANADRTSRRTLGVGELRGGVYYLR